MHATSIELERLAQTEPTLPALLDRDRQDAVARVPRLAPGWYLAVEDGEELAVLPVPFGSLHVGRSPSADLTFEDRTVSRRHAVIVRDEHGVRILDDLSRNGVVVNGRRVAEARLAHGDVLQLGRQKLRVVLAT
jgi:hypothetical protein